MTEKICPIMSRPRGWYPATSKTVKTCHHCGQIERVETSCGIQPMVWHDEYPCIQARCVAWDEYPLEAGVTHGYCRLVGNEP